jgi:pilus assembly protein CpaC
MKLRSVVLTVIVLLVVSVLGGTCLAQGGEVKTGGASVSAGGQLAPTPSQQPVQEVAAQPQAEGNQVTEGPAPLRVMVGKSLLINTADRLKRVSVTDPNVADALVVTPTQVLVHGRNPGEVSLMLWDDQERSRSFDLRVDIDITSARDEVKKLFPKERIEVTALRNALVLSGHVADEPTAKRAGMVAEAYSKSVVNVLTFGPVGADEILLEVKFAEVNRQALQQLGINIFSTGAANTVGTINTNQFGTNSPIDITDTFPIPSRTPFTTNFDGIDPLNIFLYRPDLHLGAALRALQNKDLAQILAEPNLIAVNGKEASFLAGGEFPVPVPQGSGGGNVITIQFKEFGVRLSFTPVITPAGNIHLTVKPEVSSLDFANGITVQGFVVPALITRRASTEVELQNGQSFVIAGLLDNRLATNYSKIPGLGDIPILGNLFKSKRISKNHGELMVLVTARLTSPTNQAPPLPDYPQRFMDTKEFDGKPAAAPAPTGGSN